MEVIFLSVSWRLVREKKKEREEKKARERERCNDIYIETRLVQTETDRI